MQECRGGSKGIKNKNLKKINGISLVGLVGKFIKKINFIDLAVVSTDSRKIGNEAKKNNINSKIYGRGKTPFSIWRKVQKKRVSLEQITDIIGFRIILDDIDDCYKTLGILHKQWNCIPGKFKDEI